MSINNKEVKKTEFDWINFLHAFMTLQDLDRPYEVFKEFRIIVTNADKNKRLAAKRILEFDLRLESKINRIDFFQLKTPFLRDFLFDYFFPFSLAAGLVFTLRGNLI
jgi:hypothetical protein